MDYSSSGLSCCWQEQSQATTQLTAYYHDDVALNGFKQHELIHVNYLEVLVHTTVLVELDMG